MVYDSDPDEITGVEVAADLAAAGFRVHVLKGGLPEWVAANLPTDTKDAVRALPPPAPPRACARRTRRAAPASLPPPDAAKA